MEDEGRGAIGRIIGLLPTRRPLAVLDLGCSTCTEAEALVASGVTLVGVDQDEESVRAARARVPEASFVAARAESWEPGQAGRFDVALVRRPDLALGAAGWERAFARLPHLLGRDGLVLVTTPGKIEASLAASLLRGAGATGVETAELGATEENYLVSARIRGHDGEEGAMRETDAARCGERAGEATASGLEPASSAARPADQAAAAGAPAGRSLARELAWGGDEPVWVCDALTGTCTLRTPGERG